MSSGANIRWILDRDSDRVDPWDPLGTIEMSSADGGETIVETCTNVDLFLLALIEMVDQLRMHGIASVPLLTEAGVISATREGDGFALTYMGRQLHFSNLTAFSHELAKQARRLLSVLRSAAQRAHVSPTTHTELEAFVDREASNN